jgi:hypothetical protein
MSKIEKVTGGNYKIAVSNGATGTITLDTTDGASSIQGTVVINGNLEVKGTQTEVESTVTTIADNIITLNHGESGAGISASSNYIAGIEISRGSLPTARLVFNEQSQYATGGSSGVGAFRFQDQTGAIMPVVFNSVNAEGTLYLTTPAGTIDVSGTVNYERNVFNYEFNAIANDFVITTPTGVDPLVLNNDGVTSAKSVVDYVDYALANNLQPGILDGDTSVSTKDLDTTSVESLIEFKVDNTLIGNFYSNRLEVADIKIQNNEIGSANSNEDLLLSSQGTGSVSVKDSFVLQSTPWDDDAGILPLVDTNGIKLYSRNTADTEGNVGLYYVNSNNVRDELVSKNRALLFGMLF